MQFSVLECKIQELKEKFDSLNEKCKLYGNELLSFEVIKSYKENGYDWVDIEVSGCTPLIGNYCLVGVICQLPDGTNIVNNVPGQEYPEKYRDTSFYCDHCKTIRNRKEVVLVKNVDTGDYVQLGKTCLKDYLGINLENLVNKFTYVYDAIAEAKEFSSGSGEYSISPIRFMENVSVCIRKLGYVSSSYAYDYNVESTKSTAWKISFPYFSSVIKYIEENDLYITDTDKETAKKALEWSLGLDGNNDFEIKIKAVAKQEYTTYKFAGYLAGAVAAYHKHIERELFKEKQKQDNSNSSFIGNEKERLEAKCKVIFTKVLENDWGIKTLVKFLTEDGNLIVWFGSGEQDYIQGNEYLIKFTVKEHQIYNDIKQTVVSRVKMLEEVTKC